MSADSCGNSGADGVGAGVNAGSPTVLECRRLEERWRSALGEFCHALELAGDSSMFHPHGFDDATLDELVRYSGHDLYYVMVAGPSVVGYGLLRGWDEGYAIPSLGIAIHPSCRRRGLGIALIHFLHAAASWRGASRIRLRVKENNLPAKTLYQRLGYSFGSQEERYLVGYKDLHVD